MQLQSLAVAALLFVSIQYQPATTTAPTHSAVTPAPRSDGWWQDRHKAMNERVKQGNVDLIFIGDSITQGWEGAGKTIWERRYGKRNAVNLGIGGDRTQHVLWRLDNGNLEGIQPRAAVIMIGTNNSNGEDNTPGEIAEGVMAIVQKVRERLPDTKIVLMGIFPRGQHPNPQRGKVLQANQIFRKLHDSRNVFYHDIGHKFLNEDGTIPERMMPDFLHLSKEGYKIWAESIEARLVRLMGPPRKPPTPTSQPGP